MDLVPLSQEVWILDGSGQNLHCVGTILSSYLILTIASCLYGKVHSENGRNLSVRAKGGNSKIDRLIFHPNFLNSTLENDLAILVLDKNLNFQTAPTLNIWNSALNKSSFMNFSGRLCREDSEFFPLKIEISEPFQCPNFPFQSDKLCLLPTNFKGSGTNSTRKDCSMPPAGSSLICADEETRGEFLCGILAVSLENSGENEGNGQIYTNLTQHLKWLQSTLRKLKIKTRAKANPQAKRRANESSKRNKLKRDVESKSGSEAESADADYSVEEQVPGYKEATKNIIPIPDYPVEETIAGGIDVSKSNPLPYQLSIRFQRTAGVDRWTHECGAVLLDKTTAISAAHCFRQTRDVTRYRVVAGDNRLEQKDAEEQTLPIKEIKIHLDFTWDVKEGNDIAILHFDKSGFELNEYVQGVWLSTSSTAQLANRHSVISGWGYVSEETKELGQASNTLQRGNLSILAPQNCTWRLTKNKLSHSGIMCALNTKTRTCQGDSGGPLVIPNYKVGQSTGNLLVGIVSLGVTGCKVDKSPVFLTEISHFWRWIQENRVKKTPFREENGTKPNPPQSTTTTTTTRARVEEENVNLPCNTELCKARRQFEQSAKNTGFGNFGSEFLKRIELASIQTTENYRFTTPSYPNHPSSNPYFPSSTNFQGSYYWYCDHRGNCKESQTGPTGTNPIRYRGGNGQPPYFYHYSFGPQNLNFGK